jgi:hypothetical protein
MSPAKAAVPILCLVSMLYAFAGASASAASTSPATSPTSASPADPGIGPRVLEDFEALSSWRVIASDGVTARLSPTTGVRGAALRLDFCFERGSGFCVLHRDLTMPLPPNYRFSFWIRGEAPPNNLEFKLVDTSGANVWWVNRHGFVFPAEWQKLASRTRHFRFAWGPSGGAPLDAIGAIEFAVAAGSGGEGYIVLDELEFEPLAVASTRPADVSVLCSSSPDGQPARALPQSGTLNWVSAATDAQPWIELDLHEDREVGGLAIDWDAQDYGTAFSVSWSGNGERWSPPVDIQNTTGGRDYVFFGPVEARRIRLEVRQTSRARGVAIERLRVLGPETSESLNARYALVARESPRGWFPRYFLGEQEFWTVIGAVDHDREALLGTSGAVEVDRGAFRLEPFFFADGQLATWSDADIQLSLSEGYLPIPSVTWKARGFELQITPLAVANAGKATLNVRYRLKNCRPEACPVTLYIAVRPFQVLPPWHELNVVGGVARVESIIWDGKEALVGDGYRLQPRVQPSAFGAATSAHGDVIRYLARGMLPDQTAVRDPAGLASAAWRYDLQLAPDESSSVVITVPWANEVFELPAYADARTAAVQFDALLRRVAREWAELVNRAELRLPLDGRKLVNTWRTAQAHILINADGPAIQPGSRTYERSWIRDGTLTATALLYTGHPEPVRAFLDWYCQYQYPNGKVPCVVDRRGPDPVPEHDSTGQLIYTLRKYYRFSRDRDFLSKHLSHVVSGVAYITELRQQRQTEAYRDGPPEMRAFYGLVPESISHEGYSAKPMHSYWDNFWALRGLKDATSIAQVLERRDLEAQFARQRDEYRAALVDSLRLAMQLRSIDYMPGCVELGDFDATSTATAVYPCREAAALPQPALMRTFDRYWEFFCQRRDGFLVWENYTPYEIRLLSALVLLHRRDQALQLLDFFLRDQSPPQWNQWAEVVWRDPQAPRFIGDLPHTWVAAEFLCGVRSMFVYEREEDNALVLAAGVDPRWLATPEGVAVRGWPTEYGTLSYELRSRDNQLFLTLRAAGELPPGGIVLRSPLAGPIRRAELAGQPLDVRDAAVVIRALEGEIIVMHAGDAQ